MATTFPGRLREAMNAKGIKAAALAARTGLSRAAISQYLSGQHTPSESRLALLAEVLDVSVDWLSGKELTPAGNYRRLAGSHLSPASGQVYGQRAAVCAGGAQAQNPPYRLCGARQRERMDLLHLPGQAAGVRGTNYIRPVFRSQQGGGLMVSTFAACLWAMIALFLGGAWGITAAALIHAAKDHKEDKEDDDHENN